MTNGQSASPSDIASAGTTGNVSRPYYSYGGRKYIASTSATPSHILNEVRARVMAQGVRAGGGSGRATARTYFGAGGSGTYFSTIKGADVLKSPDLKDLREAYESFGDFETQEMADLEKFQNFGAAYGWKGSISKDEYARGMSVDPTIALRDAGFNRPTLTYGRAMSMAERQMDKSMQSTSLANAAKLAQRAGKNLTQAQIVLGKEAELAKKARMRLNISGKEVKDLIDNYEKNFGGKTLGPIQSEIARAELAKIKSVSSDYQKLQSRFTDKTYNLQQNVLSHQRTAAPLISKITFAQEGYEKSVDALNKWNALTPVEKMEKRPGQFGLSVKAKGGPEAALEGISKIPAGLAYGGLKVAQITETATKGEEAKYLNFIRTQQARTDLPGGVKLAYEAGRIPFGLVSGAGQAIGMGMATPYLAYKGAKGLYDLGPEGALGAVAVVGGGMATGMWNKLTTDPVRAVSEVAGSAIVTSGVISAVGGVNAYLTPKASIFKAPSVTTYRASLEYKPRLLMGKESGTWGSIKSYLPGKLKVTISQSKLSPQGLLTRGVGVGIKGGKPVATYLSSYKPVSVNMGKGWNWLGSRLPGLGYKQGGTISWGSKDVFTKGTGGFMEFTKSNVRAVAIDKAASPLSTDISNIAYRGTSAGREGLIKGANLWYKAKAFNEMLGERGSLGMGYAGTKSISQSITQAVSLKASPIGSTYTPTAIYTPGLLSVSLPKSDVLNISDTKLKVGMKTDNLYGTKELVSFRTPTEKAYKTRTDTLTGSIVGRSPSGKLDTKLNSELLTTPLTGSLQAVALETAVIQTTAFKGFEYTGSDPKPTEEVITTAGIFGPSEDTKKRKKKKRLPRRKLIPLQRGLGIRGLAPLSAVEAYEAWNPTEAIHGRSPKISKLFAGELSGRLPTGQVPLILGKRKKIKRSVKNAKRKKKKPNVRLF